MLNRSKLWALALLAVVFLAGGAAGWGVGLWRQHHQRRGPDAVVEYLRTELGLSPAQVDSVRAVFARHHGDAEAIWRAAHQQFDSLRVQMRREIFTYLTADQRSAYMRLLAESMHQRQGSDTNHRAPATPAHDTQPVKAKGSAK